MVTSKLLKWQLKYPAPKKTSVLCSNSKTWSFPSHECLLFWWGPKHVPTCYITGVSWPLFLKPSAGRTCDFEIHTSSTRFFDLLTPLTPAWKTNMDSEIHPVWKEKSSSKSPFLGFHVRFQECSYSAILPRLFLLPLARQVQYPEVSQTIEADFANCERFLSLQIDSLQTGSHLPIAGCFTKNELTEKWGLLGCPWKLVTS